MKSAAEPKTKRTLKKTDKTATEKVEAENNLVVKVYNPIGEVSGEVTLDKTVFGQEVNERLLSQYVQIYSINQRQGNAATKTRGEVIGSTKKIFKQKGTGRARHGSIKAPIFVGGGVVGGPQPKNYEAKFNKKQKKLALRMSVSSKQAGRIVILSDDFTSIKPKTKNMANFLNKAGVNGNSALLVLAESKKNGLTLASRNLPNVTIMPASTVNPYEVITNRYLLFTEAGLKKFTDSNK